jgi:hypothetical protein
MIGGEGWDMNHLEGQGTICGDARQRERVNVQMNSAGRAERKLLDRPQEMGAGKTVLDDGNEELLQSHLASLLERLPDIDVTNIPPGMNAPANDTSTLGDR